MMGMILSILLVVVIAIVAIVFAVKKTILYVDKEYRGAAIISFIFPLVGLIIYAINIGTNKKLAKSCIAPVIASFVTSITLIIIIWLSIIFVFTSHKSSVKSNVKQFKTQETINWNEIENQLDSNEHITDSDIELKGKIVYITANFDSLTTSEEAKDIISAKIKEIDIEDYDFNITIESVNYSILGNYNSTYNSQVIWAN